MTIQTLLILLLLLTVTQTPLLVYALIVQRANKALQQSLIQLSAGSLSLPLPLTSSSEVRTNVPVREKIVKEVRRLQVPIPLGAMSRPQMVIPPREESK